MNAADYVRAIKERMKTEKARLSAEAKAKAVQKPVPVSSTKTSIFPARPSSTPTLVTMKKTGEVKAASQPNVATGKSEVNVTTPSIFTLQGFLKNPKQLSETPVGKDILGMPVTIGDVYRSTKTTDQGLMTSSQAMSHARRTMTTEGISTPDIPPTEAKSTWGITPDQSNFDTEISKLSTDISEGKSTLQSYLLYKQQFPEFEKNYLAYKSGYEQNIANITASSPTDQWWIDINKNQIQEQDEIFARDVALEKMKWQSPDVMQLDIGGGKTESFTGMYINAKQSYQNLSTAIPELRAGLISETNLINTLTAYKQTGYKLNKTEIGYSFEEMKPSEVNIKLYGQVGAVSRVAALSAAETGFTLGINLPFRIYDRLIGKKDLYEEFSARSVGLTIKPEERGTNVLGYAKRFWVESPEGQTAIISGATMGIGYLYSGLTAKAISQTSGKTATTLFNIGQKSIYTTGKGMQISTGAKTIAKSAGYPLLAFGVISTGVSIGTTAAISPSELSGTIRQNLTGWIGPMAGWGAGSAMFAKNIPKQAYTPSGQAIRNIGDVADIKIRNIEDNLYEFAGQSKAKSFMPGAKGGTISDIRLSGKGRLIGDVLSVSEGTAFIDTDISTAFTEHIITNKQNLAGASFKVGSEKGINLSIERNISYQIGDIFSFSNEYGFTKVYENVFKGETTWDFKKIESGYLKTGTDVVDVIRKSMDTKIVGADISTYEHAGVYESPTTVGKYFEKGQISVIKEPTVIEFLKRQPVEPIRENYQEAILRKMELEKKEWIEGIGLTREKFRKTYVDLFFNKKINESNINQSMETILKPQLKIKPMEIRFVSGGSLASKISEIHTQLQGTGQGQILIPRGGYLSPTQVQKQKIESIYNIPKAISYYQIPKISFGEISTSQLKQKPVSSFGKTSVQGLTIKQIQNLTQIQMPESMKIQNQEQMQMQLQDQLQIQELGQPSISISESIIQPKIAFVPFVFSLPRLSGQGGDFGFGFGRYGKKKRFRESKTIDPFKEFEKQMKVVDFGF